MRKTLPLSFFIGKAVKIGRVSKGKLSVRQ